MQGGPGLSIEDIHGTEGQEDRGKQDSGQTATTSVFAEALSQTAPEHKQAGRNGTHSSHEKGAHNGASAPRNSRERKLRIALD